MIQHRAQRVDVGPGTVALAIHQILLNGRITRRKDAGDALAALAERLAGCAKIDQDRPSIRTAIKIGGLQIAVQIALSVDRFQRRKHVFDQTANLVFRQAPLPLQHLAQRFAFLVIHDDIGGAVGLEEVPHPHHAWMADLGQDLGLIEKPLQPPRVTGILSGFGGRQSALGVGQDIHIVTIPVGPFHREIFLDGRPGLQRLMNGLIGDPETAGSEHRFNPVLVQTIANGQRIGFLDHGILLWHRLAPSGYIRPVDGGSATLDAFADHALFRPAIPFNGFYPALR